MVIPADRLLWKLRGVTVVNARSTIGARAQPPTPSPLQALKLLTLQGVGEHLLFGHNFHQYPAPRLAGGVRDLYESRDALVEQYQLSNHAFVSFLDRELRYVFGYEDQVVYLVDEWPAPLTCWRLQNNPPRIRRQNQPVI